MHIKMRVEWDEWECVKYREYDELEYRNYVYKHECLYEKWIRYKWCRT